MCAKEDSGDNAKNRMVENTSKVGDADGSEVEKRYGYMGGVLGNVPQIAFPQLTICAAGMESEVGLRGSKLRE